MPPSFANETGNTRLNPGDVVAHYEIERFIARGGMAILYQARDMHLQRRVALKLIAPDLASDDKFRRRFIQESHLAASLDHPNIIPIFAAGEADDVLYLAMRYVEGMDLAQVYASYQGPAPPALVIGALRQAAAALDAAHDAGLVHRDVKPANMLVASARPGDVDPTGHVYLTDFGLTKRTSSLSGFTVAGTFLGSIEYVAPEQIKAESVGPAADIYSLACVAYEGLTGAVPYSRPNNAAILWAHLSDEPTPPSVLCPWLNPRVDQAIAAGLSKDADARPVTCSSFVRALASALELPAGSSSPGQVGAAGNSSPPGPSGPFATTTVLSGPPVVVPQPPKPRRRLRYALAALLAVIVAAAVIIPIAISGGSSDTTFQAQPANQAPVSLTYPSNWTVYPHSMTFVLLAAQPVKALFDGGDWSVARSPKADPTKVTGVLLRAVGGEPLADPENAAPSLFTVLSTTPHLTSSSATALVDGHRAEVFEGTIKDPSSSTVLQFRIYQFAVNATTTMNIVFFSPPASFAAEQPTFTKILNSVRVSS